MTSTYSILPYINFTFISDFNNFLIMEFSRAIPQFLVALNKKSYFHTNFCRTIASAKCLTHQNSFLGFVLSTFPSLNVKRFERSFRCSLQCFFKNFPRFLVQRSFGVKWFHLLVFYCAISKDFFDQIWSAHKIIFVHP